MSGSKPLSLIRLDFNKRGRRRRVRRAFRVEFLLLPLRVGGLVDQGQHNLQRSGANTVAKVGLQPVQVGLRCFRFAIKQSERGPVENTLRG
jgi:hypothetical protein